MTESLDDNLAKSSTVHSVVVATKLLEYLADSGRPQRVTDIAQHLQMTKARVSRHLSTLSDLGMVVRMPDKSGYRLGPTLFRLSNAALDQYEITNIAYRYMVALRNQVHEAVLLAIPAGGDALIVSTVSSGKALSPELIRGSRLRVPILQLPASYWRSRGSLFESEFSRVARSDTPIAKLFSIPSNNAKNSNLCAIDTMLFMTTPMMRDSLFCPSQYSITLRR